MRWVLAGLVTAVAMSLAACGGPTQVSGVDPITTTQSGSPATPTKQPFAAPSDYTDKSWTYKPDSNTGGSGAYLKVPKGWAETKRGTYWSDFLDPSGQVRLRVDVTAGMTGDGLEVVPQAAAGDELTRLKQAEGFKSISQRALTPGGQSEAGYEIVYQFTRDGQTVQCTYRFVGADDITQARMGVYYPASEQQGAEDVLDQAQNSLQFAG
jgi:hypothetical protein